MTQITTAEYSKSSGWWFSQLNLLNWDVTEPLIYVVNNYDESKIIMWNCMIKNLQPVWEISLFKLSANHQQEQANGSTGRRLAWNKEI